MMISSLNPAVQQRVHTAGSQAAASTPQAAAAPADGAQVGGLPARIQNVSPTAVAAVESQLEGHSIKEGELLVKLRPGMDAGLMSDFAGEYGAEVLERFDIPQSIYKQFNGDLLHLKLPAGISTAEALAAMKQDPRVAYAEPNDIIQLEQPLEGQQPPQQGQPPQQPPQQPAPEPGVPNDLNEQLWGLNNTGQTGGTAGADISALDAWKVTTGSRENGPLIAVIDTGADYTHPDLAANIWTNPGEIAGDGIDNDGNGVVDDVHGYNAYADSGDPMDGHSHGTHCSGTIGGVGNNGEGVVGVNWEARIMPVKIFSDAGSTTADAIVRGLLYATRMGADITSNSWGGGRPNDAIRDAFASSPALHICAAGNSRTDTDQRPFYPMGYDLDNIVAVAATDHADTRASFSNYGATSVDVAAPGKDILSTVNGGGYASYSGTSMATPHVSGVAALIKHQYPEATNQEIKERLIYSSDKVDQLNGVSFSGGRVNAARSLEEDTTAPAAPNDFRGVDVSSRGVTVSWTATADDGWCGDKASAFDLRLGDEAFNADNFDLASRLVAEAPEATGAIQSYTMNLEPSEAERTFHFGLKVVDNVGNRSELRGATVTVPAATVAVADGFDGEESSWAGEGWGRVDVEGRGKVWTDSPEGNYGDGANTSLTSGALDLSATRGNFLKFDAKHELQYGDNVHVEVSTDGENWDSVSRLSRNADWTSYTADLSAYDGQQVQLRFRLESNTSRNADGFYLDNLKVLGDPA